VLLAADQTASITDTTEACHNGVGTTVCHNGTANHDDDVMSPNMSRVRLVQFDKNTTDPLVSDLFSPHHITSS